MSSDSIVLNWLNNEIKLRPKVINIKEEFSNGYRFGEILFKLKEITLDELKSLNCIPVTLEAKKSNFIKIKQYFQKIYSLEIREEEFDSVREKDISKAVIILYKLKNSIQKKKIHFSDIKVFINQPKLEDIQKKVKEIMDNEYLQDLTNKDTNTQENNITNPNDTYSINRFVSSRDNSNLSSPKKINSPISIKEPNIHMVDEENDNDKEYDNDSNNEYDNDNEPELANRDLYKDMEINLLDYKNLNYDVKNDYIFKSETKRKKFLPPLTPIVSTANLQRVKVLNENKKSLFDAYDSTSSREKKIKKNKTKENLKLRNKLVISEEKIDKHKEYFSTEPTYDENKDEMLKKLRENLKKKIELKKLEDKKKQEIIKKEFNYKMFYDVPEIDFFKPDKNPFTKNKPPKLYLSFTNNKSQYLINSSSRRLNYSNNLKQSKELEKLENRKEYYQKIFLKNSENIAKNLKKLKINLKTGNNDEQNTAFNKGKYLRIVNKLNYKEYNDYITKKHKQMKYDYPLVKQIIYLIIDYTVEGFFYQKENNKELIDMSLFIKLSSLFMDNKPAKEKPKDDEADIIKEVKKADELDIDNLVLTIDEKFLIEDYLNYCGLYNSKKIFEDEIINDKFDIYIVNDKLPKDYEPTQVDIDDMSLPKYNTDNYPLGESFLEILDNKYDNNNNNVKISKEINNNLICKWNNIPYKLSLIGYPLSGRKTIAENLIKKYPNLKIYSCQKLLREYYNTYKTLTEEIDINNPKYKSMKPNQIDQLKQERQKELENFEPILKIINPYIKQIKESNTEEGGDNSDSNNNNKFIPPNDIVLFDILKNKIENDFPIKSEEENKNEILEYQTKVTNINKQIEDIKKLISESNKPNPKDELAISNLEKEKQTLKQNYIKGFILVDFPTNLNQCNLIENYLTGYVSELEKPKTEKNIMIHSLENLIDFKLQPKENTTIKKSGIDFVINLPILESKILDRYNEIKYDPINDKIYTKTEINESKQNIDKKILERLVNEVPYLTKEIFDYYKQEYNDNISKINAFYNKFGLTIKNNLDINMMLDIEDDKEIKKAYQNLEILENEEKTEQNKIIDYISEKIIDILYDEKDKLDKVIFYSQHPELNTNEEIDRIKFDPEMEMNDIKKKNETESGEVTQRGTKKRKGTKRGTRRANSTINEIKYKNNLMENSNIIIKQLIDFDIYYKKNIGGFVHLILIQRNDIYTRLNLIQKKFRDFLNYKTQKKKVISIFAQKYNSFFSVNPRFFCTPKAIDDFSNDIDDLNNSLWGLITIKQKECVKELDTIKNSGFIENELVKFYNNIKNIFLVETEKFLIMIDSIITLFKIKKENEEKVTQTYKREFILEETVPIHYEIKNNIKKNNDFNNNNLSHISEDSNEDDINMNSYKTMNKLISNIIKNIELFFVNGMKLLYNQQDRTENLIKSIKESFMQSIKKVARRKNKNSNQNESFNSSQMMVSMIGTKGGEYFGQDEKLRKMFQNEKNKYKYRIIYLKTLSNKYINIIFETTKNIYNNAEGWITQSVSLQNNALNSVIAKIREILKNQRLIDEKEDIEPIEMDAFEKEEKENNEENKDEFIIKPIDDKSVISSNVYNKLNIDYLINDNFINTKIEDINTDNICNDFYNLNQINECDFYYDINKFYSLYKNIKRFEIEENVISQDILYQMFFKQFVLNVYNDLNEGNKNATNINEENTIKKNEETEEEIDEENEEKKETPPPKEEKKKKYLIAISDALQNLNTKQIFKLLNLYKIPIERHTEDENKNTNNNNINNSNKEKEKDENNENQDGGVVVEEQHKNEEENEKEKEKEKEEENENEDNEEEKNINKNKEKAENEKKIEIEYEIYIKIKEIFTILSLIGCEILSINEEEKINKELQDKFIKNGYLSKDNFMEYTFWFEKNFEYQNNLSDEWIANDYKEKKMNIKDLLFELWKDENGNNINIKQILSVCKIGNYITDLTNNNNNKYYDIIFNWSNNS